MNSKTQISDQQEHLNRWRWLPYAVFGAVVVILGIPFLKNIQYWGIRDWDLFTTLHAAAVSAITDYGQFPFWNPYIGGGNILFAHPEVPVLNPLFCLLLVFGPLIGLKLQVLVVYFMGMIGFYKLARLLGISFYGAFIPPLVFMLSSYLTLHFSVGHIPFHYFAAFPWLVFFYKKSLDKPIHILSAGGVTAFIILGSGAAVPLLFSLFFLFLISLFDTGRVRNFRPPLYAIGIGLSGILLAAVKFFPMYDYLSRYPWIPEGTVQTTPLSILPSMFFAFNQSPFAEHIEGFVWGWHEYGAFVGPLAAILIVTAIILRFRKDWPYLALIIISLTLVLGSFLTPWSPWDLLHKLPGFESIRVPSRFVLLALFAFAVLAGRGVDIILKMFKFRKGLLTAVIFLTLLGTHLFVCLPILGETFIRRPDPARVHDDFRQIVGDPNRMYTAFLANRGTIKAAWLSAYRHGRGILDYNNRVSEWYSEGGAVEVIRRKFTPNCLTFDISAKKEGTLVISQGYDTGWRRTDGKEVEPSQDLVSLRAVPGDTQIEVYYHPDYFNLGLLVSVISILAALAGPVLYRKLN
jgi:hypothetical protein